RASIQAKCDQFGWTPEWYEDAEGHKSGRYVSNRPGWLALEERMKDPDVAAIVAYDPSRLHRKLWRIGQLVERADELGIRLIFTAPGRDIDTSNPIGKMVLTFMALNDEAYANDVSQRAKASIRYRKAQGKS